MRKQIRCKWRSSSRSNEGNKVMYMPQNGLMEFLKEHFKNDLGKLLSWYIDPSLLFFGHYVASHSRDFTFLLFYNFVLSMFQKIPLKIQASSKIISTHCVPHHDASSLLRAGRTVSKGQQEWDYLLDFHILQHRSTLYDFFLILPHLMDLKSLNQCTISTYHVKTKSK